MSTSTPKKSSSWLSWPRSAVRAKQEEQEAEAERKCQEELHHRKRLAQILRYIASMHQALRSADGSSSHSFVRDRVSIDASDFFQYERGRDDDLEGGSSAGVLFSTNDFRRLIAAEAIDGGSSSLWSSPPFSFYASASSSAPAPAHSPGKKRAFASLYGESPSSTSTLTAATQRGSGLWLRLTRLGPNSVVEQPEILPIVEKYLHGWLKESAPRGCQTTSDLLTLHHLERAPGIPSTIYSARNQRAISGFLKRYKRYLCMKLYQQTLEPIFNRLFAWIQQQNENNQELVWGLGHARMMTADGTLINGPLLEVLVEVELAPDGGLLVKPRQHTGVALNREVVAALVAADPSAQHSVLSQLHRTVGELESFQISPGQPTTYVSLLKKIAMEISSGGSFQASSKDAPPSPTGKRRHHKPSSVGKLIVSEAWCLYSRAKPSSVWARDATTLADNIAQPDRIGDALPTATWSLTHGPGKLEQFLDEQRSQEGVESTKASKSATSSSGSLAGWLVDNFVAKEPTVMDAESEKKEEKSLVFPLATSDSQHRIADLLLRQNYPAVLAEGPPGTGKTHSIANIVSAYLCQGKRVLVTSKNSNALNVLRGRLPKSIQELCVDVTMSELQGMRQLQQTVERLAIRVSAASADVESEKCGLLQRSIDDLEAQLEDIDHKLTSQSERVRNLLHQPDGIKLMEKSSDLILSAPWLMQALPGWSMEDLEIFSQNLHSLKLDKKSAILTVSGFGAPPLKALISLALANAGSKLSTLANVTRTAVAALPLVGSMMSAQMQHLHHELENIRINNKKPASEDEWITVADALRHSVAVHNFQDNSWLSMVKEKEWPEASFDDQEVVKKMSDLLETAVEVKRLQIAMDAEEEIQLISKFREMDAYRARLATQIQHHSEELADAAVVAELSRSFSPDAQSALIKFSQIAGAAKFSKSAKSSKMTQRQRRRRQEYLEAFDKCVRQIPCWIMTSSQISQYLPAETLFDLVVIDESSQSDVTVLPGMMRGKQWLIVGDGKQVSPTEAFVSDDDIDNLKATLPSCCPFADALLPGRSFFDMCAQAFPRGRVVLSEHFRCAPEIINFSNSQFYDGRLVPLRLPTKGERLSPSIIDVKVSGVKNGKINEAEADRIVDMIRDTMEVTDDNDDCPRTIGIISLIGEEQSRLIRGRLLDAVGPEKMARHEVLIGEPPSFQGAERDIIFLSMVCSPGRAPTQNQQFHFQRANVAMSRARDRCVLVRSLDLKDIPSLDDCKVAIIEFFMNASIGMEEPESRTVSSPTTKSYKKQFGSSILKTLLGGRGYHLVDMGVVWKDAVCVEHRDSDTRAAIMIDCEESSPHEWSAGFAQQKAIERVGWKCLRIDALSLVVNHSMVMDDVMKFLSSVGIPDPSDEENEVSSRRSGQGAVNVEGDRENTAKRAASPEVIEILDEDNGVVAVSSEGEEDDRKPAARSTPTRTVRPDSTRSSLDFDQDESIEASKFGEVVDLNFLLRPKPGDDGEEEEDGDDFDDDEADELDDTHGGISAREDLHSAGSRLAPPRAKKARHADGASSRDDKLSLPTLTRKRPPAQTKQRPGRSLDDDGNPSDEDKRPAANDDDMDDENQEMESGSQGSASSSKRHKRRRLNKYARDGRWYPGSAAKENDHDGEWYDTDSDLPKDKMDEDDESWQEDGEDEGDKESTAEKEPASDGDDHNAMEEDEGEEEVEEEVSRADAQDLVQEKE